MESTGGLADLAGEKRQLKKVSSTSGIWERTPDCTQLIFREKDSNSPLISLILIREAITNTRGGWTKLRLTSILCGKVKEIKRRNGQMYSSNPVVTIGGKDVRITLPSDGEMRLLTILDEQPQKT